MVELRIFLESKIHKGLNRRLFRVLFVTREVGRKGEWKEWLKYENGHSGHSRMIWVIYSSESFEISDLRKLWKFKREILNKI